MLVTIGALHATENVTWEWVLEHKVDSEGVDYNYIANNANARAALSQYLKKTAQANPRNWQSQAKRLAFWINAYNACVISGVISHYPVRSVKDIPGFFTNRSCAVAGKMRSLNEIESSARAFGDPRVHFALVCASTSCPSLRTELYQERRLDAQLNEQAREFLNDPERGLRIEDGNISVSQIFRWYSGDFKKTAQSNAKGLWLLMAWPVVRPEMRRAWFLRMAGRYAGRAPGAGIDSAQALFALLRGYLGNKQSNIIHDYHDARLQFMPYDWTLNDTQPTKR